MDKRANKLHEIFCDVVDRPTDERERLLAEQRLSVQRDIRALVEADRQDRQDMISVTDSSPDGDTTTETTAVTGADLAGDTTTEDSLMEPGEQSGEDSGEQSGEDSGEQSGRESGCVIRETIDLRSGRMPVVGVMTVPSRPMRVPDSRSLTNVSESDSPWVIGPASVDEGAATPGADFSSGVCAPYESRYPGTSAFARKLAPGTRVAHYELIRELGRGGMGAVFLARDTKLGRRVAIKFLSRESTSLLTRRFLLEARATARCTHENIVIIHDVDEYESMPYMVLEYLRGQPLSHLRKRGPVPAMRAVELIIPVVRALVRAHGQDIAHRDLKPDNIFVTESGVVKVLDFGIAKLLRGRTGRSPVPALGAVHTLHNTHGVAPPADIGLTRHGAIIGTLAYMSPEQWNGSGVDHRSDIWAVGIILYQLITGRHPLHPFRGMQLSIIGVLDHPMPSAKTAPVRMDRALADVIDTCLQKDKRQRFADARGLLDALEALVPSAKNRSRLDSGICPYPGLTAFQEADADRFFGRKREVSSMVLKLQDTPLLAVVGPSGVGKSSLVRAGLVPALKRSGEDWETIAVRPGRHPMSALANIVAPIVTDDAATMSERVSEHQSVLARLYSEPGYLGLALRQHACDNNRKYLLFIDQFEELYTLIPDRNERMAFTACLRGMADDPSSPLRIVASIRSDFLDRVAEDKTFMTELSAGLFFVTPPGRQSLRDALVQPAEMARYRFETPALVDAMLEALDSTSGSLPLLQFTAARLWDLRDSRRRLFTEKSYQDMGGLSGALASHADSVLAGMSPSAQSLVRTIFLRLVTAERTRAIASVTELREMSHEPDAVERLVSQLVDARLLVVQRSDATMGPSVEIVHESLIDCWPMLARWLDESQEDVLFLEQLRTAAGQWDNKGRPEGLLWRGEAMDDARRWRHRYRGKLSDVQDAFLRAVFDLAMRTVRRKRIAIVAVIVTLSLMVAVGSVALVLIRNAEREVRDQLELVERKERERKEAMAQAEEASGMAELSREQLADKNVELSRALSQVEDALTRANEAEKKAQQALVETRAAKAGLEKELDNKRKRLRRLEEQVGKRGKGLKK